MPLTKKHMLNKYFQTNSDKDKSTEDLSLAIEDSTEAIADKNSHKAEQESHAADKRSCIDDVHGKSRKAYTNSESINACSNALNEQQSKGG